MVIRINRAPVLTLRASVVAERFGHDERRRSRSAKPLPGTPHMPKPGAWG